MRMLQRAYGPTRFVRIALVITSSFLISWRFWHPGTPDNQAAISARRYDTDTSQVSLFGDRRVITDGSPLAKLQEQQRQHLAALDAEAAKVCDPRGWKPWHKSASAKASGTLQPRKVYDLVMVNDEIDWLEVRLNTTFHEVDYFVIVEAAQTFTGMPKPLTIRDNWGRLTPYHSKILYHQLVYPSPDYNPPRAWDREDLQRDALFGQVLTGPEVRAALGAPALGAAAEPRLGDVLIVADVDEIPRPEALRALRRCEFPKRLTMETDFYYYGFQYRHKNQQSWPHPQATTFAGSQGTVWPVHLRNGDGGRGPGNSLFTQLFGHISRQWDLGTMSRAGWHCSSCFATIGQLMHKLESFSHEQMNQEYFRQRDRAVDYVRRGVDLWDRPGQEFDRVDNNTDIPSALLAEPDRYGYLLNRDGSSAGFLDYP